MILSLTGDDTSHRLATIVQSDCSGVSTNDQRLIGTCALAQIQMDQVARANDY